MALLLTLDASVWVAVCRPVESGHASCRMLLELLSQRAVPLLEPSILPVEVATALRRTGDPESRAMAYAEAILALPQLTLVTLDDGAARRALAVGARHRLRGADALYVAVALQYGSRLVTLDDEQLRRSPKSLRTLRPEAAVALC